MISELLETRALFARLCSIAKGVSVWEAVGEEGKVFAIFAKIVELEDKWHG